MGVHILWCYVELKIIHSAFILLPAPLEKACVYKCWTQEGQTQASLFPSLWANVCSVMSDSLRPHGYSPLGSSVHRVPQARILEGVAISFSRGSSRDPQRDQIWGQTKVSCVGRQILYHWATWKKAQGAAKTWPTEVPPGIAHCLALITLGFGCLGLAPPTETVTAPDSDRWPPVLTGLLRSLT